jgi:hypothetical protein
MAHAEQLASQRSHLVHAQLAERRLQHLVVADHLVLALRIEVDLKVGALACCCSNGGVSRG